MTLAKKRILFVAVFVPVFVGVSVFCLMLAVNFYGIGPSDTPVDIGFGYIASELALGAVYVLWSPIDVVHNWFFWGQSLPGGDLPWIAGCGLLYAIALILLFELFRKLKNGRLTLRSRRTP